MAIETHATIWIAYTSEADIVAAKDKEAALNSFKFFHGRSPEKLMSIPYFPQVDAAGNKIIRG